MMDGYETESKPVVKLAEKPSYKPVVKRSYNFVSRTKKYEV
ncbi:hypothetical protein X915_gp009 [Bacillus phage vB_BanS-Tsamsa]|uniref:Uncharacterized protein n=1 Tax=Bacillus phage vB_BanS-Tsamsa TaxID=1308863 RepID=U5J9U2_9CAUD|nr:hypothetical protein X915_gp009 [Bacillus phage vB_BanS-Tsamsa]AGI11986.1 hypothetical protein [Bacillus phage vB_BanS-Tsamsa]